MVRLVFGWISAVALGGLVAAPLVALGVCSLVDRGPGGDVRASLFPFALTALDPFVWSSFRHSVTIAGLAALATIVGGVVVGRVLGGLSGPLRRLSLGVVGVVSVLPPVVTILFGAEPLLESVGREGWERFLGWIGPGWRGVPADPAWLAWLIAASLPGTALGALTYVAAFDRLDSYWKDAARTSGDVGTRAWRRLVWPLLRPSMARIAGFVFTVTLADPGPALLLGLRRSLGYQMVAAIGVEPFPRIAVLGLLTIVVCGSVRVVLRIWSGPWRASTPRREEPTAVGPNRQISMLRLVLAVGVLVASVGLLLGLLIGPMASGVLRRGWMGTSVRGLTTDPVLIGVLMRSAMVGLGAVALSVVSDRVLSRLEAGAGCAATSRFRRLARASAPPALTAGVVVLAIDRIAILATAGRWGGVLDGGWPSLVAATAAAWLATVTSRLGVREVRTSPAKFDPRFDAAVLAGARRRRARRLARASTRSDRLWNGARIVLRSMIDVAPAVLILTTITTTTIGPALLMLHERPASIPLIVALGGLVWTGSLLLIRRDPLESSPHPH